MTTRKLYSHNLFSHLCAAAKCIIDEMCVSSATRARVTFWRFHLDEREDDVKGGKKDFLLAGVQSPPPPHVVNVIGRGHVRPAVDMAILEVRPASGSVIRFHRDSDSLHDVESDVCNVGDSGFEEFPREPRSFRLSSPGRFRSRAKGEH